jgi:hypothetical protein
LLSCLTPPFALRAARPFRLQQPLAPPPAAAPPKGDDAVHDAIRQRELEAAAPWRVVRALAAHGGANDDVLWAALFVLAVLVRESSSVFEPAAAAVAAVRGLEVRGRGAAAAGGGGSGSGGGSGDGAAAGSSDRDPDPIPNPLPLGRRRCWRARWPSTAGGLRRSARSRTT